MDTTSLAFCGAGGDSLGAHRHSKDHRPDLKQMILAVVIDGEGRPICTEMLPGNTADVTVLLPVVDRLRERFHIGRVCVVADRRMISAATIAALEERKLEYILGARERSSAVIRRVVLEDEQPLTPLLVERARGRDPALYQGGQGWCCTLHRLPQRGRSGTRTQRAAGDRRRARQAAGARR